MNIPAAVSEAEVGPYITSFMLAGDSSIPERMAMLNNYIKEHQDAHTIFICQGYTTCLVHELRHFHDYLATPFGANVMVELMLGVEKVFAQVSALRGLPAVAVPLQAWRDLTEDEYEAVSAQIDPCKLPRTPPEFSLKLNRSVAACLERVKTMHGRAPSSPEVVLTTRHFVETTAMEVQAAQMYALWGGHGVQFFAETLRQLDERRLYTTTWDYFQLVTETAGQQFRFNGTLRNALFFFSLCGSAAPDAPKPVHHPVERFLLLIAYILQSGAVPEDKDVVAFLDNAAQAIGLEPLFASLQRSVDYVKRIIAGLRLVAAQNREKTGSEIVPESLFSAFDEWLWGHQEMVNQITAEPLTYFDPQKYFVSLKKWVAAPTYLAMESELFEESQPLTQKWLTAGWVPVWGWQRKTPGGEKKSFQLMRGPVPSLGTEKLSAKSETFFSSLIWLMYLLNTKASLRPVHREIGGLMMSEMLNGAKVVPL